MSGEGGNNNVNCGGDVGGSIEDTVIENCDK